MKQVFFVLSLSLFAFCHSTNVTSKSDTIVSPAVPGSISDTSWAQHPAILIDSSYFEINNQFPWLADTIRSYIQLSTNEMTKLYIKDSSIVFMYDGYEKTNTGGYVSVRLGADSYNGEGTVFSTAEVISVDILSREITLYDIATDSSYLWVRPQ
ncbi:hypothetical protein DVR12_05820 [Chitinophaga silvatica]|uniref:Uncharacterized protein n=1 Tax=Chitinophaga silvatica TaxID=2282649 RepID=A0A3E1YDS6_9BACT|nr:hypothetical protein [Chitinophaga silvatica]RFS24715.1 hypothetical protein DVR12_05820 [Chitinophaga silvatica]